MQVDSVLKDIHFNQKIIKKLVHIRMKFMQILIKGFFGHKAAKIMKKIKNIERRMNKDIQDRKGLIRNVESVPELEMNFQPNYHSTLLETRHLDLKVQDKKLFKDLNLIVKKRGIVSLKEKNGSGKIYFLKSVLNKNIDVTYQGILSLTNGLKFPIYHKIL